MIDGNALGDAGFKHLGTKYSDMDCQDFVEECLKDCGLNKNLAGSNAWFREVYNNGEILTPEECVKSYGCVPTGAFLFILANNGKEPEKYKRDNLGNASHIGLCTNKGEGAIHSSESRGCVAESKFAWKSINGGWNRVGLWNKVKYGGISTMESYDAIVTGGALNLRQSPSTMSERICSIPDLTKLKVTRVNGEWGKTTYLGDEGYVMLKFLSIDLEDCTTVNVEKDELEKIHATIGRWLGHAE